MNPSKSRIPKAPLKPSDPITPLLRKRKPESQDSPSSSKMPKTISQEELNSRLEDQRKEFNDSLAVATAAAVKAAVAELKIGPRLEGFDKKLDNITDMNSKSNEAVQVQIQGFQDHLITLQGSVDETRIKFEEKIVDLEGQFNIFQENALKTNVVTKDNIIETVKEFLPDIRKQVTNEILSPIQATWNALQAEKVLEHEHSMIVFGLHTTGNPIEAAGDFLKTQLKVPDETLLKVSVKQAVKLGRGDASKPPPFLIKFGHPSERNMILTYSRNIADKNIKVERQIPKNYQAQNKIFKEEQWKLKNMPGMEYKTQIVFDGHKLVLRYRINDTTDDKFHWTIFDSWSPPMESNSQQKTSLKTPTGSKATPPPTITVAEMSNRAFFITIKGMTQQHTEDNIKYELQKYLKLEHSNLVSSVKASKKADLFIVYCDTWASAKTITNTYKDKFLNHDVSFTLFSKEDPALKTSQ